MTDEGQPEPGLVHVEHNTKRPNAVVLDRRTVAATVLALIVGLVAVILFVLDVRAEAEAARAQSVDNEQIIEVLQEQAERNGALIEQGVDCLVALQQQAVLNAEEIAASNAAAHGFSAPVVSERVSIPTDTQLEFLNNACPRFFRFQEAGPNTPLPPAAPPEP